MSQQTKHTGVQVRLPRKDGDPFKIIGPVREAMRKAGVPFQTIAEYTGEAMAAKTYDEALRISEQYVTVL